MFPNFTFWIGREQIKRYRLLMYSYNAITLTVFMLDSNIIVLSYIEILRAHKCLLLRERERWQEDHWSSYHHLQSKDVRDVLLVSIFIFCPMMIYNLEIFLFWVFGIILKHDVLFKIIEYTIYIVHKVYCK